MISIIVLQIQPLRQMIVINQNSERFEGKMASTGPSSQTYI